MRELTNILCIESIKFNCGNDYCVSLCMYVWRVCVCNNFRKSFNRNASTQQETKGLGIN